jgi:hypothetical protein
VLTARSRGERIGFFLLYFYSVGGMKCYRISSSCTCIVIVPLRDEKRRASKEIFDGESGGKTQSPEVSPLRWTRPSV